MINIYIVLACYFMAAFFYSLEFKAGALCLEYANKSISNNNKEWLLASQKNSLWIARLFLLTALALSVVEQVQFIMDS